MITLFNFSISVFPFILQMVERGLGGELTLHDRRCAWTNRGDISRALGIRLTTTETNCFCNGKSQPAPI